MPINLTEPTELLPVPGVRLAAIAAGIRYRDRDDLVLMDLAAGSSLAAVFTQNAFCAAPVIVAREHLAAGGARCLLINAGNANAGTGERGLRDAQASCAHVAEVMDCRPEQVLPFSTGVIGEPLPVPRIREAIPRLAAQLSADTWIEGMRAIMTTDTVGKGISRRITLSGGTVVLTGIAKGSGMIRPDMATMLAFLASDVSVPASELQAMLEGAVGQSFNCITVDGDTSTNDACVLAATGVSGIRLANDDDRRRFMTALQAVCDHLAQAIVRDGEGATKFITLHVTGAATPQEARQVADAVAHSPLVKTALFASDPNWGRILAAVGRAGVPGLDVARVRIEIDDVLIVEQGARAADYTEEAGQRVMGEAEIPIHIHLARGSAEARIYTCDFSFDYVRINAEYRS
jgi:glutamate N-acetyltransferase / amino-acid N-acetyltransferase